MNALFKKSQQIVNLMNKLEIQKYHGYSVTDTDAENFLVLAGISITSSLLNTYLGNDLSKFIPRTSVEIMGKFKEDIENNLFSELENFYSLFTKKC